MKRKFILVGLLVAGFASAQQNDDEKYWGKVGINTITPQATIDIRPSTDNGQETATTNEGILIPKLSKTRLANISVSTLVEGTLVYVDESTSSISSYVAGADAAKDAKVAGVTTKGFYFYDGTTWQPMQKSTPKLDYIVSADGTIFMQWFNKHTTTVDMNNFADMADVSIIASHLLENSKVQNFVIKEGVTTIEERAFYNNPKMAISLPNSLLHIEKEAFYNSRIPSLDLPNILTIGQNAFYNNTALTSLSLPVATTIGNSAFQDNTALTSLSLPAATTIEYRAFFNTALTSVNLPAATTIGYNAFYGNVALTNATIGPNITSIGTSVFGGTANLPITLTIQATTPPILYGDLGTKNITIKVPMASVNAYKTAPGWSNYANQIVGY